MKDKNYDRDGFFTNLIYFSLTFLEKIIKKVDFDVIQEITLKRTIIETTYCKLKKNTDIVLFSQVNQKELGK